ncbi:MAG TPA: hypothetical protein VM754_11540 [Actinomycetota bacterium]|nr:hypothetical protein [Actinomycetota bacterium]
MKAMLVWRVVLMFLLAAVSAACGGSGGTTVSVTANEYAFQGLAADLAPGDTTFRLENRGSEVHELHLFKLNDEVSTVTDLVGRSIDESMGMLDSVGMTMADPGDRASFDADLSPGRYAAVCMVPVGAHPEGGHTGHNMEDMEDVAFDPNADTHFRRGMFAEFAVG